MLGAQRWNTDRSGSDTCTLVRGRIGHPCPGHQPAVRRRAWSPRFNLDHVHAM